MERVVALRSQFPHPVPPMHSPLPSPAGETAAVTQPQQATAIVPLRSHTATATLYLAQSDEDAHPAATARAAAEIARDAYIRASIAAGVSPLPLQGV